MPLALPKPSARLAQSAVIRGSTRPAIGEIRSLILSTRRGALKWQADIVLALSMF